MNYEPDKFTKIMRIFVEIECIKNQGVLFGPKELNSYFPYYGAVMKFNQI